MCGIVGTMAYGEFEDKKDEKMRQESMIFLTSELLQLTQPRGKEATGIATLFSDCDYMGLKMGVAAQEFVLRAGGTEKDYEGYVKIWRKKTKPAKITIGHCRKPTDNSGASPIDNKNNHPIKIGDIIGVHNGTISNDDNIFTNLGCKRDGQVDSEAIFRLLHHFTNKGEDPFTTQAILETCRRISGSYAVLAFNGNNPFQLAAFRDGKPLEVAMIRPLQLLLVASEAEYLKAAIYRYNVMANLYLTGANKFNPLKKGDVDLETLTDDSLYLFDIRKKITTETKINELYITEKVPRSDKLWTGKTTSYNTVNVYNRNTQAEASTEVKKTEAMVVDTQQVGKTTITTQQTDQPQTTTSIGNINTRKGMVMNKALSKSVIVNSDNEKEEYGNVEIDCENGTITSMDKDKSVEKKHFNNSNQDTAFELTESDKPVDDLLTDPAKIEVSDQVTTDQLPVTTTLVPKTVLVNEDADDITFGSRPDVLENALKCEKEELSFSNNADLSNCMGIVDEDTMKSMSLYSLANRIKAYFFKRGWYKGYIACEKDKKAFSSDSTAGDLLKRIRDKYESSQKTIRNMKNLTGLYDDLINDGNTTAVGDTEIIKAIRDTFNENKELDLEVLNKAFKPGDIRKMSTLKKILISLQNTPKK